MVFPINNFEANSKGEYFIWDRFKKILPNNYISFHNYYIDTQEADVILLVPDSGILIIEIKGFYPQRVVEAVDNTNIILSDGNVERSPYKQAVRYKNQLISKLIEIDNKLSKHIIAVSVCFPYFSSKDFINKHLDRIADSSLFITADDLVSWDMLSLKIEEIFNKTNETPIYDGMYNDFNKNEINKIANIFVPGFSYEDYCKYDSEEKTLEDKTLDYSLFVCETEESEGLIEDLYNKWIEGTKIFFFSSCKSDCDKLINKAKDYIKKYSINKALIHHDENEENDVIFNLSVEHNNNINKKIYISNGEDIITREEDLEYIGKIVNFNYEQYCAEHASCDDMVVKAGAGTGKTYLLVSRIAYLCWKHKYTSDELAQKIVLLTFTNDATNEMRDRLVLYFSNMFKLTYSIKYFSYTEAIENMDICTIDSYAKKIINRYAFNLGLGNTVSITTGTLIKRNAVRKILNEYAKNNTLVASSYYIEKFLLFIIEKLGSRSVDASELIYEFNKACENEPQLGGLIKNIPYAILDIEKETENNNQIPLSYIIIYLRKIVNMIKNGIIDLKDIETKDYVFIDEFQDTDNTQIELLTDFKKALNFKIFAVGDPKQSIYRFRGASSDKAFTILDDMVGYKIRSFSLVKNYRTNAQLLEYMDKVITKLACENNLITYTNESRLVGVKNKQESKRIFRYEIATEDDRESYILKILCDFENIAKDDEKMAILVRSNAEVDRIRDICYRHNIFNVDIDKGGKLYQSDAAIDLYKLLLALQNNDDVTCLYNLYTTSYCNTSLKKNSLVNSKNAKDFFYNNLPESLSNWRKYVDLINKEPILKVIRNIIDEIQPWNIYSQRIAGNDELLLTYELRYKNNIDKLFEKIVHENNGVYLTLSSLIEFLRIMITTHQEEEERELESDVRIQCKTVHRAKGKEYSYVFFPFADERIVKTRYLGLMNFVYYNGNIGYSFKTLNNEIAIENEMYSQLNRYELDEQSYEEARIFYVAITRAKKGIIYIKNLSVKEKTITWQQLLEE